MFIAMVVASFMMLIVSICSMRLFLRVTEVPKWLIVPVVMTCCVVGTFALNNRVTDLYLLIFIGITGYTLRALGAGGHFGPDRRNQPAARADDG
jgi:putative tricarboxylic transport membrane protein